MEWGEALRHVQTLRADPGTQLAAAIEDWDYPLPREVAAILDLFDLEYAKTGAKGRKPHPGRPYKQKSDIKRIGATAGRTREEVVAILNRHGHSLS